MIESNMNANAFSMPQQMPTQQLQQPQLQQPQQQPMGVPPQWQQNSVGGSNPFPTSGPAPPPTMFAQQGQQQQQQPQQQLPPPVNGNYHMNQMTSSMNALNINQANKPPIVQQQQPQPTHEIMQPSVGLSNSNSFPVEHSMPPKGGNFMPPRPNANLQQNNQHNNLNNNNNMPLQPQMLPPNSNAPTMDGQGQYAMKRPTTATITNPPSQLLPQEQQTIQQQQQQQRPPMPPLSQQQQQQMPPLPPQQQQQPQPKQMLSNPLLMNSGNMPGLAPHPPNVGMSNPPNVYGQPQQQQQPQMQGMPPPPPTYAAGINSPLLPPPGLLSQPPLPQQQQQQPPMGQNYPQQQPGYPPMPPQANAYGSPQPVGNYPGAQMPMAQKTNYNPQYQPAAAAQRRLDPDQMPNPIQVMIENERNAGGAFVTNQAGLLPPLVTTNYVVQDQGNCSPRYVRSSLYTIPVSADMMKTTALPFSLIVSPFASIAEGEFEPPIVDFGALGPIRCNRCKAYMSPNMQFIDAGRRFQCLMCKVSTEVPTEYFQHLDHTGQRLDKYERPELVLGTYEFLATKDYCRNNIQPTAPAFIFILDVSYNSMKSGLVHLFCAHIKEILKCLPVDQNEEKSSMKVGFITYNSSVHFYNIKSSLAQPQMMVVGDVQDMFMPLLDGFLCSVDESEVVIDALMEQIPKMFLETKETETILYPAIQAGLEALKASNCAGKLIVFTSTLPIAEAPGKLKNREDRKLLGTDKEKTVLVPQCSTYNQLGHDCVQNGCSVDLFVFNNAYIDIATIGQVARLTGGEVFKYTYFQAENDGQRLIADIKKNISRPIAFDAVLRVRTSGGIRPTDFYGHMFMSNTTDVELASIDSTKSIAVEIKHDDKLPPDENVYLQIALLYTSCSGQRRLRILNLSLRVASTIADIYKTCDLDAMMLFFAKQSCVKLMEFAPKVIKDGLIHRCAQILACYRKNCTSPTSAGQLILPECLKLLPLYLSCLLKNDAISGGSDMTLDDRSYVMQFVLAMDLNLSVNYLYPRFLPLHGLVDETTDNDSYELPHPIRCTHEKMSEDGAYILENGIYMFIWLGQALPQSFIQPLFGVQCTAQVNAERFKINKSTQLGQRIQNIINTIMSQRSRDMRIICVRQNDKLESVFRHFLVEDRGNDGSASYTDFLCHMHKEIKDLLS